MDAEVLTVPGIVSENTPDSSSLPFHWASWKSWLKTWSSSFYCLLGWFHILFVFNKKVGSMGSLDVVSFVSPIKKHCQYVLDTPAENNSFRDLLFGLPDVGF